MPSCPWQDTHVVIPLPSVAEQRHTLNTLCSHAEWGRGHAGALRHAEPGVEITLEHISG